MKNRKQNILNTAIELFSKNSFDKVSTAQISKVAGVSEGLVFKHFTNKKMLFVAVLEKAEEKVYETIENIISEKDASNLIKNLIEMPFEIKEKNYKYWRLLYKNRWEEENKSVDILFPLIDKISASLSVLGFQDSEKEAGLLFLIINSITANIIREGKLNQLQFKYFLIHKYTL